VPAPRRRRWPLVLLLVLVSPLVLAVGGYLYLAATADRQLREAMAEADRLDPHWRLEEVEAARADVPDGHNSAAWARSAKRRLPVNWPSWEYPVPSASPAAEARRAALQESFQDLQPQRQLSTEQTAALRAELTKAAAAVADARKLADLPQGRYSITYSPDWIATLIPHVQDAREVARLLEYDADLRAQDCDADGAFASCRAALNTGRSLGDEPILISQMVRMVCRGVALSRTQRVLAQGEPSDDALREMQRLLEQEEPEPLLLYGARGERGGMDRLLELLQTNKSKLTPRQLVDLAGLSGSDQTFAPMESLALMMPVAVKRQRAAMLRHMNQFVEIAKLPPEQQEARFQELRATAKGEPVLVRLLAPAAEKVARSYRRSRAEARCAIAALAAERYRRARGQWPDRLETLVETGYLDRVPDDPYAGGPLRWRRLDDGAVVYSVGPDGQDDGGKVTVIGASSPAEGTDVGFRLWDVARRRQPPAPPKPAAAVGAPAPNEAPPGEDR
jgi:hypothetical protein